MNTGMNLLCTFLEEIFAFRYGVSQIMLDNSCIVTWITLKLQVKVKQDSVS